MFKCVQSEGITHREKIDSLLDVDRFNPKFRLLVIGLGIIVAVLEEVDLRFVLPTVGIVQIENLVT